MTTDADNPDFALRQVALHEAILNHPGHSAHQLVLEASTFFDFLKDGTAPALEATQAEPAGEAADETPAVDTPNPDPADTNPEPADVVDAPQAEVVAPAPVDTATPSSDVAANGAA